MAVSDVTSTPLVWCPSIERPALAAAAACLCRHGTAERVFRHWLADCGACALPVCVSLFAVVLPSCLSSSCSRCFSWLWLPHRLCCVPQLKHTRTQDGARESRLSLCAYGEGRLARCNPSSFFLFRLLACVHTSILHTLYIHSMQVQAFTPTHTHTHARVRFGESLHPRSPPPSHRYPSLALLVFLRVGAPALHSPRANGCRGG